MAKMAGITGLVWRHQGQIQRKGRAGADSALHANLSTENGSDDVIYDAQAESATTLPHFCSEKWLEYSL